MNKRIISLLLAITLILGSVFSLSSCMAIVDLLLSDETDENQGGDKQTPETPSTNTGNNNQTETPEFYPSTQNPDISVEDIALTSRALLSVVSVYASFDIKYGYPSYSTETATSRGSGVIYKLDRENGNAYIITNYHVVYHAEASDNNGISTKITLRLYGQESENYAIAATYVGGSMANDIAVLKVTGSEVIKNSNALAASVANSDTVNVFDTVYAIGNPEALGISVTEGIVSVESELLAMTGADGKTAIQPRVIRVSAAINDGNSGGGLFDGSGQLVGIVNAKRNGSSIDNIGYAIPSNVAARLADNIILYCDGASNTSARKAMLGITITATISGVVIDDDGKVVKVEIPEVKEISEGSAVSSTLSVGDRINSITVDGLTQKTTRIHHVIDMMLLARVGSRVTLNITRGTQNFDVVIDITEGMFQNI